ncbi:putative lipid II flippase FtsW [Candidatus Parcubacteria bacterium]|nr:putative lipid II flippase FtsW [Candidatus Parcubacteria bacterium]
MARSKWKVDKPFLSSVVILMAAGFVIFYSASLGLLAKNSAEYSSVTFSQAVLGLFLGTLAMLLTSYLDYKIWKRLAFWLLGAAVVLNILVLFPQIGFEHGGARRWIVLGGLSFQTSELLKLAFVVYFAAWAAGMKGRMENFKEGFLPLLVLLALSGGLLLKQPDTDTFMMLIAAGLAIFIAAGGKWKYVLMLLLAGVIGITFLAFTRPYVMQRINTYLHPETESQGASYQIQQSLIAIGSGGVFGRGFGQSVQKFNFLPEPIGDSIFAVEAEEFGFVGAAALIILFVFFAIRGLKIASESPDPFGRLLVVGLVIMITAQAFVNIGAMLGILPLSGITLPFVSHGGTSLFVTLLEAGIVLSVSKHQRNKR